MFKYKRSDVSDMLQISKTKVDELKKEFRLGYRYDVGRNGMYYYSDEDLNLMKRILEFEMLGLSKQEISNRLVHNTPTNEVVVQTEFKIDSNNKKSTILDSNIEQNRLTTSKEIYNSIDFRNLSYSDWIETNLLNNPFATEGVDFIEIPSENTEKESSDSINNFKVTPEFSKKLLRSAKLEKDNTKNTLEFVSEALDMLKLCVLEKQLSLSNFRPKNDNRTSK